MKPFTSLLSNKKDNKRLGVGFKQFRDHEEMASRLTKTLYYGKSPKTDRPSLAMTNLAVKIISKAVPERSLDEINMDYAASVSRNACVSPCSLMLALVYIERLRHCNPEYLQTVSSSDTFLVSMMIASKFLYDEGEDDEVFNDEWAASANLEVKEVNYLERKFLAALNWNLFVNFATLSRILHHLESRIAFHEGLKRGWFSYTDLDVLSRNFQGQLWRQLFLEHVVKVAVVCAVSYVAGLMTLVGSTMLVCRGNVAGHVGQLLSATNRFESPFAQNQFSSNFLFANLSSDLNILDTFDLKSSTVKDCPVRALERTVPQIHDSLVDSTGDIPAFGSLVAQNGNRSADQLPTNYRHFPQLGMFTSSTFVISSDDEKYNSSCSQMANQEHKRTCNAPKSPIAVLAS